MGLLDLIQIPIQLNQARINRAQQNRNIDMQNAYNKQMAEYEFQKNTEMWNKMNSYNTPQAQMDRFKSAGLNPNLIYGQGSSGTTSQLPKYQAPEGKFNYSPLDLTNVIGAYQDFRVKQAQIDNLKAQRRILDAQGTIKESDAKFQELLNKAKWEGMLNANDITQLQAFMSQDEIAQIFRSGPKGQFTVENQQMLNKYYKSKYQGQPTQLEKTQAEIRGLNLLNDLREKEKEFLNLGGKYFNPIIQFLNFIRGGVPKL